MTPTTSHRQPGFLANATMHLGKLTVAQYHRMIETGILTDDDPIELLEGYMVQKMSRGKAHDFAVQALTKRLVRLAPTGWDVRVQCAVTLPDSEPEPDFAVVRGDESVYRDHHPGPSEIGALIEISSNSLNIDRNDKGRIYARAGVPVYWVVNVVDKVIEVFTEPSGATESPAYAKHEDYPVGTAVPVVLDGATAGTIPVADIMT